MARIPRITNLAKVPTFWKKGKEGPLMIRKFRLMVRNVRKNSKSSKNFHCTKKTTLTNIESIPRITNLAKVNTYKEQKQRSPSRTPSNGRQISQKSFLLFL